MKGNNSCNNANAAKISDLSVEEFFKEFGRRPVDPAITPEELYGFFKTRLMMDLCYTPAGTLINTNHSADIIYGVKDEA